VLRPDDAKVQQGPNETEPVPERGPVGIQVSFGPRSRTGILWWDKLERHQPQRWV